jgi:beta-galactosidase
MITEEILTTSEPASIRLSADRQSVRADAYDIVNIKIEIIDKNGLVVPGANNLIEFKVEGEGILKGSDNGNPEDKTQMQSKQRSTFNGLALAVIQSTEKSGSIRFTAMSIGLKEATLQIVSHKSENTIQNIK